MADIQGGHVSTSSSVIMRDYRKGNWTVGETMVLIEAKKMDDERRMKRSSSGGGSGGDETRSIIKPAELRWKWVEDYCWKKGCLRSQNQCNDKWDNLMRDYKKVREYERRIAQNVGDGKEASYWKLEKNERKERNLPTNMVPHIYEALVDAVEKRAAVGGASVSGSNQGNVGFVMERPVTSTVSLLPHPVMQQHHIAPPLSAVLPLLPPPHLAVQPPVVPPLPYSQPLPPVDSDTSEHSDSPAKRRRRASGGGDGGDQGGGTSGGGTVSATSSSELGTAISRGASMIAEALQGCEEREERRHRDLLSLHERRLQIEETKTENNRQGISGLIDAINKLANSIHALASNKNQQPPPS